MTQSRATRLKHAGEPNDDIIAQLSWLERLAKLDNAGDMFSPQRIVSRLEASEWNGEEQDPGFKPFENLANQIMHRRRLFLLDTGEIGLGSHDVEPGDSLCIIADGGRTPFVLRKNSVTRTSTWKFVGEAYVRGIMHGEAVDQMKKNGETWTEAQVV